MNSHLKKILRFLGRPGTAAAVIFLSPIGFGAMPCLAAVSELAEQEGAEVLTRGPLHEAFATTITFKPVVGIMVPKAPPTPIEELPPDQRPDGTNVTWIPGYWAWDDEGSEFLWVSGIWRNLPPGRQWMPGYWSETGDEYQWVSGYWADASVEEVEYLPEPPVSREAGPNIERPSEDHSWMPGSWIWYESNYRWRPGYWDIVQPDWVWIPSYYCRSPRGYIYVDGYYDYAVARRGLVFAPMRFSVGYYSRPGYYYRPYALINISVFTDHLFLRPRHRHYYFGDYYAPEYRRSGYYASYNYYSGGHGYDPIYAHERWRHRNDDRWERRREENFRFFRDNRDERPPRTLAAFQKYAARADTNRRVDTAFVTPISKFDAIKGSALKLKPVDDNERQQFTQRGREIRDFGEERKKLGKRTADTPEVVKPGKGEPVKSEPVRVKVPRSPLVATVPADGSKEGAPPKRREFTIPDDKSGDKLDPDKRPGGKPKGTPGVGPPEELGRKPEGTPGVGPPDEPGRRPKEDPKMDPRRVPKDEPKDPKDPKEPKEPKEPKVEPRRGPTEEPKDEPKVDPRRGPREEPKEPKEPKVDPRREPKEEPKEPKEPKVDPRRVPKDEPKEPKVEPKREPNIEPKREPKPEPKIEPKREPRPEPKPQPRVEPRPQPQPKAEPKPQPRAEPKPQPRAEPKPQPKPDPKRQPKTESSDKEDKDKRPKG